MSDNTSEDTGKWDHVLPCGCRQGIVKRQAPEFDEKTGAPVMKDGAFVMKEVEEIQEQFCDEHTAILIDRQEQVQKALAAGASPEEALKIMAGVSPFMLEAHEPDDE